MTAVAKFNNTEQSLNKNGHLIRNISRHCVNSLPEHIDPFHLQWLKWIGNKQRYAHKIAAYFPKKYGTYWEPFVGSGSILSVVSPNYGMASDISLPLINAWQILKNNPDYLISEYSARYYRFLEDEKYYNEIRSRFNFSRNELDLVFLSRTCYGGIMRFRKSDGFMSTPKGTHEPLNPSEFEKRVRAWGKRIAGTHFSHADYAEALQAAKAGDLVYCDPPYNSSQNILYGAHSFSFDQLLIEIESASYRGVKIALSIDTIEDSIDNLKIFRQNIEIDTGKNKLNNFHNDRKRSIRTERLLMTYGESK